jgi:hypothetical protein
LQAGQAYYGGTMRWLVALLVLVTGVAAPAQQPPVAAPTQAIIQDWQPTSAYITPWQDEVGYRAWYSAAPIRPIQVKAFNNYLVQWEVGGVVPTWQLLRTATSWLRCGAQPFEVPPMSEWPHIVQTLRYVRDYVIPAVGPVEPVSGYRNPVLNACAGGAPESAHKHYSAVDLVPLQPIDRETLMRKLCAVQLRRGEAYDVGLGFYAFMRFHVDTTKFRRWGADPASSPCPALPKPVQVAAVPAAEQSQQPPAQSPGPQAITPGTLATTIAPPASTPAPTPAAPYGPPAPVETAPPAPDPLAPLLSGQPSAEQPAQQPTP